MHLWVACSRNLSTLLSTEKLAVLKTSINFGLLVFGKECDDLIQYEVGDDGRVSRVLEEYPYMFDSILGRDALVFIVSQQFP